MGCWEAISHLLLSTSVSSSSIHNWARPVHQTWVWLALFRNLVSCSRPSSFCWAKCVYWSWSVSKSRGVTPPKVQAFVLTLTKETQACNCFYFMKCLLSQKRGRARHSWWASSEVVIHEQREWSKELTWKSCQNYHDIRVTDQIHDLAYLGKFMFTKHMVQS